METDRTRRASTRQHDQADRELRIEVFELAFENNDIFPQFSYWCLPTVQKLDVVVAFPTVSLYLCILLALPPLI